jgi:MinD-like ATPase involved in chromosome partitioning or flagellar assembly
VAVPVLTAVSDAVWEAELVAALARGDLGVVVVRRCVDLADLLATAATGQARAVLVSSDLRRLDREALGRLAASRVAVVGLVPPDDEAAERRLRQLGVATVRPTDSPPEELAAAVLTAVEQAAAARAAGTAPGVASTVAEPRSALPDLMPRDDPAQLPAAGAPGATGPPTGPTGPPTGAAPPDGTAPPPGAAAFGAEAAGVGRLVAVWGPTGAPGRTPVAVALAAKVAALDRSCLLVDADVYGGTVAQALGLLDESPGVAAAARLANSGALDLPALAGLAREISPSLRVLSGMPRADRWPELRPASVEVVLELARSLAATSVVDCGFCLEQDEELAYDTAAPRRNGATLAVLDVADTVVAVGSADPVGLQRLVRGLGELREAVPGVQPVVVVNRLRASAVPGDAAAEIRTALRRYAGVEQVRLVPLDVPALDSAVATGRTLVEIAPASAARLALADLAAEIVGVAPGPRRRGRSRARRSRR